MSKLVLETLLKQELCALAEQHVLPKALAGEVAKAAFPLVWKHLEGAFLAVQLSERFDLYYAALKAVVESPAFADRVTLFVYTDADHLGQALQQIDADNEARRQC